MFKSRTGEPVEKENWQWIAVYDEGQLMQFDEGTRRFHNFDEIDTSRIKKFVMTNGVKRITLNLPAGATPIHFYDTIVRHKQGEAPQKYKLYGFGFKTSKTNKRQWVIIPGDFIVETDDSSKIGVI